jgi:hypothetical protein
VTERSKMLKQEKYKPLLENDVLQSHQLVKKYVKKSTEFGDELLLTQDDPDARKKRKITLERITGNINFNHSRGRPKLLSSTQMAALATEIDVNNILTTRKANLATITDIAQKLTGKETIAKTTMYKAVHDMSKIGLLDWNRPDDISAMRAEKSTETILRKSFVDFDNLLLRSKMLFLGSQQLLPCHVCQSTSKTFCTQCAKVYCSKCSDYVHGSIEGRGDHSIVKLSDIRTTDNPVDEVIFSNADESWLGINNKQGGGRSEKIATVTGGSHKNTQEMRAVANPPLTIVISCHARMIYDKTNNCFQWTADRDACPPMFINGHDKLVSKEEAEKIVENGCILSSTPETARMNFKHMMTYAEHYVKSVKPNAQRRAILFLDGVDTHLSLEAMQYLERHFVTPYIFESNLTHLLQPCDGTLLKIFKQEYKDKLKRIGDNGGGWNASEKTMVLTAIEAIKEITLDHVATSWSQRGILPINLARGDVDLNVIRENIIRNYSTVSNTNTVESVAAKVMEHGTIYSNIRTDRLKETSEGIIKLGQDQLQFRKELVANKKEEKKDEMLQMRGRTLDNETLQAITLERKIHKFDNWRADHMIKVIQSKKIAVPSASGTGRNGGLTKKLMIPALVAYERDNPNENLEPPSADDGEDDD